MPPNRGLNFLNFTLLFLVALAASPVLASSTLSGRDAGAIENAQRLMIAQRYPEARAAARAVLANDPRNIDAIHTLAAIEQTRILDYESYTVDGLQFVSLADSLLRMLENIERGLRGADSVRSVFYRANILGGIGVIHAKRGAVIDGARISLTSQNLYKAVKRIEPDHLGADFGLGVFDYYFGTTLRFVPFVGGGSVERGLAALERSLGAPFPFNLAAKSAYAWILIDRKEFARADSLARAALRVAPGSTLYLRIRALIALWTGQFENAIVIANRLMDASRSRAPVNWSDLILSYYVIASANDNLGRREDASAAAQAGLALDMPQAYRNIPHVREHYRNLNRLR